MICPHCQKDNPEYASICVWCGRSLRQTAPDDRQTAPPRRHKTRVYAIVAAAMAVILIACVLCAVLFKAHNEKQLIGTWKMNIPVSKLAATMMGEQEDSALSSLMLAVADRHVTVTVYCRFYEDDTYSVYVTSEELTKALKELTQSAVDFLCDEGIYGILEEKGFSKTTVDGILGLVGLDPDSLKETVSNTVDGWMQPLYDRMASTLSVPNGQTGERRYELDGDRLYVALEQDKHVEDSVYVLLSFDGKEIRLLTDTQLDKYLTGAVWTKVSDA